MEKKRRPSVLELAQRDIDAVPVPGPVDDNKVQTAGAAGIARRFVESLPIIGFDPTKPDQIVVRPGYQRDPSEYKGKEWEAFVADIKASNGNLQPIDVRKISGVPGKAYELLAGERRLTAIKELGLKSVYICIRQCDDRMADRIHETENTKRKAKAAYSRAIQYKAMMDSGLYASQADMASNLGENAATISVLLKLIDGAPDGMWAKVQDRVDLTLPNARKLVSAYENPGFKARVKAALEKPTITVPDLMAAIREPSRGTPAATKPTLQKHGKDGFRIVLPKGVTESQAKRLLGAFVAQFEAEK